MVWLIVPLVSWWWASVQLPHADAPAWALLPGAVVFALGMQAMHLFTILRGVTVGSGSVIASHALVNKDIPRNSIVGGVPARVLKTRGADPQRGS